MSGWIEPPTVACLCPTYGRPKHLIANTIACYLAQDYPEERRELLILDDLGNVRIDDELAQRGVKVISTSQRYKSLPDKYNALRKLSNATVQIVWEDDELYLPHHVSSYVDVLFANRWSHPATVWSTYTGKPDIEQSGGRFHAALGFRTAFLDAIGGWPETDEPNFDQQLIALATRNAPPARPNSGPNEIPSYVFRWADTGATHGQGTMDKGNDWYREAKPQYTEPVHLTLEDIRHDDAALKSLEQIKPRQ